MLPNGFPAGAPIEVAGGGPAGVVERVEKEKAGLLGAGVDDPSAPELAVFCAPPLGNANPPVDAPNWPGDWAIDVAAGGFNPSELVAAVLVAGFGPKLNPVLAPLAPPPPNKFEPKGLPPPAPPEASAPPNNDAGFCSAVEAEVLPKAGALVAGLF